MPDYEQMAKRQQVLADFGEFTLRSENLDEVLTEACRLVGEALGTGRAKVLEIQEDGQCLLVRAGVGWDPGIVGQMRPPMGEHSSETFAISEGKPVISQDIHKEERFAVPEFMKKAGVVALVNVPIFVPGGKAYGLLQVDATEPRDFGQEDIAFLRTYATILGPVVDRLQKVSTLRSTEERFRLVVENARDYAILTCDPEDRITDWYPGAEAVFGWTAEEATGQPAAIIFTAEDREAGQDVHETETARREGWAPNVRWHLRKDGSRVFIEGTTSALRAADGSLRGFLKIGQDVTERRQADEALRESEARFRQFGEASSDLLWIRNAETLQFEYVSPAFETIYGQSREAVLAGDALERWVDLIHPEDRDRVLAGLKRVQAGERVRHEFRIVRPSDGETRWVEDTDFPLLDESGHVHCVAGIAEDVTDQKASAARREVLLGELQHRTRNLLGVVRSIAQQTMAQTGPGKRFEEQFYDRLSALSRVQGLLSRSDQEPITIRALIRTELDALGADALQDRIVLEGPSVRLRKAHVQTFALALHELATNARKYGALTSEHGRLSVTWRTYEAECEGPRLLVEWVEEGFGPPPEDQEPMTRGGYGRELIERALPYVLQTKTSYELGENRLCCSIDLPLAAGADEDGRS
jgi:PAS domain S-box-containing protein